MLAGDKLWNERQVGYLRGGPAKLKDDDERDKVGQTGPLRGEGVTAQTLVEDKGKGQHDAQRTWVTHTQANRKHKNMKFGIMFIDSCYVIFINYTHI